MVGVLIKFRAKDGLRHELTAHLVETSRLADKEAQTLLWTVHTSPKEPEVVWVYEAYADEAAQHAHESTPAYAEARAKTGTLLADAPEVFPLVPVGGKGLN